MPRKGPPALPQDITDARGTTSKKGKANATTHLVVPITGEPEMPSSIRTKAQKDLWKKKVNDLTKRGVLVAGCEDQLAVYVCSMVKFWQDFRRGESTASQLNTLRLMGIEFYDTPASQYGRVKGKEGPKGNRFRDDDRPPPPPKNVRS